MEAKAATRRQDAAGAVAGIEPRRVSPSSRLRRRARPVSPMWRDPGQGASAGERVRAHCGPSR